MGYYNIRCKTGAWSVLFYKPGGTIEDFLTKE